MYLYEIEDDDYQSVFVKKKVALYLHSTLVLYQNVMIITVVNLDKHIGF